MTNPLFSRSPKASVIGALILIALAVGWLRAQAPTTSGAVISGSVSIDHGRVAAFRVKANDGHLRDRQEMPTASQFDRLRKTARA